MPFVKVEIELDQRPVQVGWAGYAIDINCDGMALMLPDGVSPGCPLMLSFRPNRDVAFRRVPARVVHYEASTGWGAVEFANWSTADTLALLSFLVYGPS